jgi:hypothetical protein
VKKSEEITALKAELEQLRHLYSEGNQREAAWMLKAMRAERALYAEGDEWESLYAEGDKWKSLYTEVCDERNELKASLDWWVAEANRRGNVILGMTPDHAEWHRIVQHDSE